VEVFAFLLQCTKPILDLGEFNRQFLQFEFFLVVRLDNVLVFLTVVRKDDDCSGDLESQLVQILITLLNLLIQGLVLNLQLFVIDQMEAFSELLLSAEDLLLVGKSISEGDVLQSVLMNFLVLGLVMLFPVLDHLGTEFLASSAEHGVLCNTSLQFLELMLDFLALLLFLVELVLEFGCHAIVAILSLLQVESDLMDVGESVEVFVLMEELVLTLLVEGRGRVHQDYLSLALFVLLLELLILTAFILDGIDELFLHILLLWKLTDTVILI